MMFRLSDTKSPVNGREREAPETISTWQNAGFAAAETRVEGFRASGKARTQKSHPHWASQHMASIVRQIGTQRRKETEIAEGMEREIMAYEERRQRETDLVLLRAQECSDFVDFLVLVNRYGPVPDWQRSAGPIGCWNCAKALDGGGDVDARSGHPAWCPSTGSESHESTVSGIRSDGGLEARSATS
ncbi:Hypothetical Protein FCC1311_043402 [Hondaea fermentalgiana]|uniref:Uncharacterized protein n=1 Tax=Hondaea fermentalgiana TaxID=2315210 RepID=A0A2R5GAT1_9STRA|nr:Hypothetical Protein FCC1311_043402 [Hondaea fermentalgiana]|eukprot:GBG28117.1 Hypothetical Protein FCC1311_043402 [Hondaea fermentalgiana]